jgi:hypothetical protein
MKMWKRKALLGAIALSSIAFIPIPASAQIYIDVAPPAPRHEVIPAARAGYVWQPGFYDWRSGHHVWVKGYWVKERQGMYWHPSRWEQRDGRWAFEKGRWDRERYAYRGRGNNPLGDRDRDGIPNAVDRDKDGDGVRDSRDRAPNNPNRQ